MLINIFIGKAQIMTLESQIVSAKAELNEDLMLTHN
jgi:hypothetical protein